jgi:protein BCP1
VISIQDEDDAYAVASVVSVNQHKDADCMKRLRSIVVDKCPAGLKTQLEKLFDDEKNPLGLIVNERMLNMPQQLMQPLHKSLSDDLAWVRDKETDKQVTLLHCDVVTQKQPSNQANRQQRKPSQAKPAQDKPRHARPGQARPD